ncbi:MAG: tripartite tricarboxylate transporter permease [Comamonadaceae bacterium]|nr:tripartite tricarboxylate transporter permease [Comamonadaceae bacterium]
MPLAMGLFGMGEILYNIEKRGTSRLRCWRPQERPLARRCRTGNDAILADAARGSVLGFGIGGPAGPACRRWPRCLRYAVEKQRGQAARGASASGAIEGVAGPETANNAATGRGFVPLLALGIPTQQRAGPHAGRPDAPRRHAGTAAAHQVAGRLLGGDRQHVHRQRRCSWS